MNNMLAQEQYTKPHFWTSDDASFTSSVKNAALKIKTLTSTPNNALFDAWGLWLANVILDNHRGESVDVRSPGDHSTYGRVSNESFDLTQYQTVGEFLENELTGDTCATFCSGSGFRAQTYADEFHDYSGQMYNDFVQSIAPELFHPDDLGMDDRVGDALDMEGVADYDLEHVFQTLPLQEMFFRNMGKALEARNRNRLQHEADAAAAIAREAFLRTVAGTELPKRIEQFAGSSKWDWGRHNTLWDFLDTLVEQNGAKQVAAALMFSKVYTSNKVATELKARYAF